MQQKILALLSDNLPYRKFEIIDALGGQDHASEVTKSLSVMVATGLVKKFKHGIDGSPKTSEAAASALPPRMNKTTAATTYGKVIRMIQENPATAVQIKEGFGFSRQRAEQILSKAEQRGQIRRVETTGERGQYVYSLPPTYKAILKVIVEEGQASTSSIPSKMDVKFANPRSINLAVKTMEERGYISRTSRTPKNGILWQATEMGLLEAQKVDEGIERTSVTAAQLSEGQP